MTDETRPTAHVSVWVSADLPEWLSVEIKKTHVQTLELEEPQARYPELHDAISFAESLKKRDGLMYILVAQLHEDGSWKPIRHWARSSNGWEDLPVKPRPMPS